MMTIFLFGGGIAVAVDGNGILGGLLSGVGLVFGPVIDALLFASTRRR